jgi:hypothetical protein
MTLSLPPISVRNSNPGNLRADGISWRGLCKAGDIRSDQDPDYCMFTAPVYGFRALAIDLRTKWSKDGLRSIGAIIPKYAPPAENNTEAYVKAVSIMTGIAAAKELNLDDPAELASLCRAITVHESGGWFFATADLNRGIELALTAPGV